MQLNRFVDAKNAELARLRAAPPIPCGTITRTPFLKKAPHIQIIAEYKRASPSKGMISTRYLPEDIATLYTQGGARAISVLTEERYFDGRLDYLEQIAQHTALPLLRKDFIFDELQVLETATTPASAVLLIVALTPTVEHLYRLRTLAESYGIQAVVEIFNEQELDMARASGARYIQVNSRNLETLVVDPQNTLRLMNYRHDSEFWIAASGISSRTDLNRLTGYDAALIGTALMASPDPLTTLRSLTHDEQLTH